MNKTVSITTLPAATGFGPGDSLVGVNNGEAFLFPYSVIGSGGTGSGATGETGATGATGATGSVETTDRLISTNNLEVVLDSQGTLNTPLLLPTAFTAVCDETHMIDPVPFEGDDWWEFEVEFQVSSYGTIAVVINNIFPILTNPGYESGYTFRFTEADHGISNYNFDIQLNDVVQAGPAGWTSNLEVSQGPEYPSTIESLGAIKFTSNNNSLILGTDGVLYINNTIEFPLSNGNNRTGEGNNLQFEKGSAFQKIISTQDGTELVPTVERLVISGGDSYNDGVNDIGEGGDIYLWAGKGANGGDIKVDAGNSSSQEGGTIKIRGGYSQSSIGGFVQISSGYGGLGGGDISITADGGGTGIEAGGEISMNTVGGTWTFKNNGGLEFPNGSQQTTAFVGHIIEVTYSELVSLISGSPSTLIPGSYYLITDFKTCYDQPDFNWVGNSITTGNYKQGPVEPILVLATSTNTISDVAYQPTYPNDKIKYDWTFSSTEVTNGSAFGRITERIDEFNNRTDYDHRSVLFKRYDNYYYEENNSAEGTIELIGSTGEVIGTGTVFSDYSIGDYIAIPDTNVTFFEIISISSDTSMVVSGLTILAVSPGASFYSAQKAGLTYKQNNISIDYTEHPTFLFETETIISNYIGDVAMFRDWSEHDFLLPNNVFGEDVIGNRIGNEFINNTFSSDVEHNVIGDEFENNTIYNDSDFTDNQIAANFRNNLIICDDFNDNVIGDNFNNNKIFNNSNFVDNQIGVGFNDNTIYSDFEDNKISNGFNYNVIDGSFNNNSIGNQFVNNTIYGDFYDNQISNEFKGNMTYQDFNTNKVDWGVSGNEFNGDCSGNTFGPFTINNDFLGDVYGNVIKGDFGSNTIGDGFGTNNIGSAFFNNTIAQNFAYNEIGNLFTDNTIGEGFGFGGSSTQKNYIGDYFYNNTVGEYFYNNRVGNYFQNNTLGDYFQWNVIDTAVDDVDFTPNYGNLIDFTYTSLEASPATATDDTYVGLTGTSNGPGVNASFDIGVSGGSVIGVTGNAPGKLYQTGDTITITGNKIGGLTGVITTFSTGNLSVKIYKPADSTYEYPANETEMDYLIDNSPLFATYYSSNIQEVSYSTKTGVQQNEYGMVIEGYIQIPSDDTYYFGLSSDDGSDAFINEIKVADWYGPHGDTGNTPGGNQYPIPLTAGTYPIKVRLQERDTTDVVSLLYSLDNVSWNIIPDNWFPLNVTGATGSYSNISATGGGGTGSTFDVTVVGGLVDNVTLNDGGGFYSLGDSLTIPGSAFGGTQPINITVDSVYSDDVVITVTDVGPNPSVYESYTCQIFERQGGNKRLSFYDENDILTVKNINE